ncbi:MAG TPA: YdcF family protein [Terracidiphilus sp.]|nr:YdcF family protein [Terracidiphilus sp.]
MARGVLASSLAVIAIFGWAILARQLAPRSNTSLTRFDTIIVLGTSADPDGNPTPRGLSRVTESVHEYERGVAPRIIFSGGSTSHGLNEARVLARAAEAQGIPESAVFVEPEARDTIHNVCYSERIMKQHGWQSAEVISNGWHLNRAALILGRTPIEWSVHAAPSFERETGAHQAYMTAWEIAKTVRYLVWTRQMEKCEP